MGEGMGKGNDEDQDEDRDEDGDTKLQDSALPRGMPPATTTFDESRTEH
jgi:hypothetical protein